ncbi:MAG: NUDIX domain-containing protein [Chlamydiia bacterium]|nr:NUDIX domain-containing protein [Chlamydiia bacterium]
MNRPKVGIGVLTYNEKGELLLGKRKNAHGKGMWQPPGGHLEFGETFFACAERELLEETGLQGTQFEVVDVTNDHFVEEKLHYVTIFVRCLVLEGVPQVLEPHKCESWHWFDDFPNPLFLPLANLSKEHTLI